MAVFFFHLCLCVDVFLSSTFFVLIKYSLLFSHTCRPQQKRVREQSDCGCCAVVVVRSLVRLFMLALCSLLFSAARAQLIFVDSFFVCRFFVYTILFIRFLGFSFSCFSFLGFSSFFFFVVFLGPDRLRLLIPNFPICIHYVERSISRVSGSVVTRLRLRFRLLFYVARHFRLFYIAIVCSANNCLLVAPSRSKCAQQASGASFYFLHYMAALPLPLVTKNSCYHAVQLSNVSINNNNNKGRTGYFDQAKPKKKSQKLNLPLTSTPTRPKGRIQIRAQNTVSISQDLILRFICNYLLIMRYAHKPMLFKLIMEYLDIFTDINT